MTLAVGYLAQPLILSIYQANPSGETDVGFVNSSSNTGALVITRVDNKSFLAGEYIYLCILFKDLTDDYTLNLQIRETDTISNIVGFFPDGTVKTPNTNINISASDLGDGWTLVQGRYLVGSDTNDADGIFFLSGMEIGSQLYVQAAFFGKADDYPAVVDEGGVKININAAGQQVDYIGIARHNLNQANLTVTIKYNGITVVQNASISDAQAILFLQNQAVPDTIDIIIKGADEPPQIGVIYIGKSLRLERSIYVGHTPITYGRNRSTVNGISENGQYLGEIVKRQMNMTAVSLSNLTPAWYRSQLDPFFKLTPRVPCFWAWRPETYPDEIGYAWIDGEPSVSNEQPNGMMSASWNFEGLA